MKYLITLVRPLTLPSFAYVVSRVHKNNNHALILEFEIHVIIMNFICSTVIGFQPAFTCSKLIIETLKGVKYFQS